MFEGTIGAGFSGDHSGETTQLLRGGFQNQNPARSIAPGFCLRGADYFGAVAYLRRIFQRLPRIARVGSRWHALQALAPRKETGMGVLPASDCAAVTSKQAGEIIMWRTLRTLLVCVAAIAASACATTKDGAEASEPQWAANGWLTPGPTGEPEIIGLYLTREACEKAVDEWMSRQVVGNPVFGDCLPIDRH